MGKTRFVKCRRSREDLPREPEQVLRVDAAVLVARDDGPERRAEKLRHHAQMISVGSLMDKVVVERRDEPGRGLVGAEGRERRDLAPGRLEGADDLERDERDGSCTVLEYREARKKESGSRTGRSE